MVMVSPHNSDKAVRRGLSKLRRSETGRYPPRDSECPRPVHREGQFRCAGYCTHSKTHLYWGISNSVSYSVPPP